MTSDFQLRFRQAIHEVPDFPKPGILFYDLTPVFGNVFLFKELIDELARPFEEESIDCVVSPEARGFILGAAVAYRLGAAFVPLRKQGRLPRATVSASFSMEYREAGEEIFAHTDAHPKGARVLLVDDVLATGGTAHASARIVEILGGDFVGAAFALEIAALGGRKLLPEQSLVRSMFSL